MLKQLKQFFGWRSQPSARPQTSATAAAARTGFTPAKPHSAAPQTAPKSRPLAARPVAPTPVGNDEDVSIPLQSVLDALPLELKCVVVPLDVRGATLTVALHKVLPQLPQGPVKLCFGEIRRAAPTLFSIGEESDEREVDLPLSELLSRINPELLQQLQAQQAETPQAEVNTDAIESSFNQSGSTSLEDFIPEFAPAASTKPGGGPMRVPLPVQNEEPELVTASAPRSTLAVEAEMLPEPFAVKARAPQPAEAPTLTATEGPSMNVPLATLAANWPPLVRAEIEQLDCAGAQVVLPESLVQAGMKQGKVAFPWQTLRAWLTPAPPAVISKQDSTPLELPLEVLMPIFLARWKQTPKTQPKLVVDETIPALFSAAPVADAATESAAESNAATPAADAAAPAAKTPGTDFKNRYISPTEVVARASALNGVAGAMVVLPEGLVVASKLSGGQDADALAAFLAQAMSRIAQFAKEADVGELSRLSFWANEVPWLVFRLNGIFVVTFGWAGGELPTSELAVLSAELERKRNN